MKTFKNEYQNVWGKSNVVSSHNYCIGAYTVCNVHNPCDMGLFINLCKHAKSKQILQSDDHEGWSLFHINYNQIYFTLFTVTTQSIWTEKTNILYRVILTHGWKFLFYISREMFSLLNVQWKMNILHTEICEFCMIMFVTLFHRLPCTCM